ncbi:DUF3429 domain-containing protein [Sulfuritalea sp.]|uniref:DUF3429 domain-containing protein n=1 Tax=Sulfuritalea sp. TaxID=2480090 RepID=UPI001ACA78D7|nr:DUF3429 domain-containing protein [Sulfuritalea sp.]MBN8474061.1 DUF3429 domain-containing protein [Sulfuritalea sp.]
MAAALPRRLAWLGYGGLLPFIATAAGSAAGSHHDPLWLDIQHAYGAVILSYVGALHWGAAMLARDLDEAQRDARYLWSVMPALIAWPALLLTGWTASILLVVGFLLHYWQDRRLVRHCALPAWYLPLRGRLTGIACVCMIISPALSH